jgi:TrmH family RNA methyltransferase
MSWTDNVHFLLIEPKEPGNIGSSARALKNMGFKNLSLVNPCKINQETLWFACNATDIIDSITIYNSLDEAIKDKSIVVGTTRRVGKRRGLIRNVTDGVRIIRDNTIKNKVAILFGREDRGLLNEEVEKCGFLISIPTSADHPSLNLSHAVLIIAYELFKLNTEKDLNKDPLNGKLLVNNEELSALYPRIAKCLKLLGYITKGDKNLEKKIMLNLKHFIGRAGLTNWELKMLHGICSQIEKKLYAEKIFFDKIIV